MIQRGELWLEAKKKKLEDQKEEDLHKELDGYTFQPEFFSKRFADKLGITAKVKKRRKSISRRPKSRLNSVNSSCVSMLSGRSMSQAIKQNRSYGNLHLLKSEYYN